MSKITRLNEITPKTYVRVDGISGAYNYLFSPTYEFDGERHRQWEIVGVFDGCARIISDEKKLLLQKKQFYIHKPMEFHAIYPYKESLHVGIIAFSSASTVLNDIADKVITAPMLTDLYGAVLNDCSQVLAGMNSVPPLKADEKPQFAVDQTAKILCEYFLICLIRLFVSPPP